tara:strand:- start:128 stop:1537 length:1410 start_codon:yes stop_codon:yes gene_type:complete
MRNKWSVQEEIKILEEKHEEFLKFTRLKQSQFKIRPNFLSDLKANLKKSKKQSGGGGCDNAKDVCEDAISYINTFNRQTRNEERQMVQERSSNFNIANTNQHLVMPDMDPRTYLAIYSPDREERRLAAMSILNSENRNEMVSNIIGLISLAFTVWGTANTYLLFSNITNVTSMITDYIDPTPPPPEPQENTGLWGFFTSTPAPAPEPEPEGMLTSTLNWVFSGGVYGITRLRFVLWWVVNILHQLVSTSRLGATAATFFVLSFTSIILYRASMGGFQFGIGWTGIMIDTRNNSIRHAPYQGEPVQNRRTRYNNNDRIENNNSNQIEDRADQEGGKKLKRRRRKKKKHNTRKTKKHLRKSKHMGGGKKRTLKIKHIPGTMGVVRNMYVNTLKPIKETIRSTIEKTNPNELLKKRPLKTITPKHSIFKKWVKSHPKIKRGGKKRTRKNKRKLLQKKGKKSKKGKKTKRKHK